MKCENCNKEHDGSYGSGRFCNTICSHSFSAKMNNSQRKNNISKSLKRNKNRYSFKHLSNEVRKSMTIKAHETLKRKRELLYNKGLWNELPLSYKRRKILEE